MGWAARRRKGLANVRTDAARSPVRTLDPAAGYRLRFTGKSQGRRGYDWAWIDLETAHAGHKGLLVRRNRLTGELAYYLAWTPGPVPLQTLVTVAGMRWRIEECFQGAKEHLMWCRGLGFGSSRGFGASVRWFEADRGRKVACTRKSRQPP